MRGPAHSQAGAPAQPHTSEKVTSIGGEAGGPIGRASRMLDHERPAVRPERAFRSNSACLHVLGVLKCPLRTVRSSGRTPHHSSGRHPAPGLVRSDHQLPSCRRCHLLPRRATSRRFVCLPPSLAVPRVRRTPRRPAALGRRPTRSSRFPQHRWFRSGAGRRDAARGAVDRSGNRNAVVRRARPVRPCCGHSPQVVSPRRSPSRRPPSPRRSPGATCSAAARRARARPGLRPRDARPARRRKGAAAPAPRTRARAHP